MKYLFACLISIGLLGTTVAQEMPEYTGQGKFRDQGEEMDQTNNITIPEKQGDAYVHNGSEAEMSDEASVNSESEGEISEEEDYTFNRSYEHLQKQGNDPYMKQRSEFDSETEADASIEGTAVPDAESSLETESTESTEGSSCLRGQMNYLNPNLGRDVNAPKNMDYKYELEDGEETIKYQDDDMSYFSEQNTNGNSEMRFEAGSESFSTETKKGETVSVYELDGENESLKVKKDKNGSGKVEYKGDFDNLDQANSEVFDDINNLGNFGTYSKCQ